jgi:hypothetical protein
MTTADPVIDALHGQVDCYRRLSKLAELQHEHVQQERTESLLEVLAHRQQVLDQLAALERVVAPAKRQWNEYLATLPAGARDEAERLLAETRRLLEAITAADCNDVLVLQQRKLNIGRQISQAASARQVNRTYAAAAYGRRAPAMDVQQ